MDDQVVGGPESPWSQFMTDTASTDRYHVNALRILEEGPYAPPCPRGHERLTTMDDQSAPTGTSTTCPTCGARRGPQEHVLRTLLTSGAQQPRFDDPVASTRDISAGTAADSDEPGDELLRKSPSRGTRDEVNDTAFTEVSTETPRGLQPDGTIRTTGWLQIGGWVVSSGIWATLAGLTVGLMLAHVNGGFAPIFALIGYTTWKTATRWGWPASLAVNRERVRADDLRPGTYIRIHGTIGPVGLVDEVAQVRPDQVRVYFNGGTHQLMYAHARCYVVELRN
jgi:hypothetical protein